MIYYFKNYLSILIYNASKDKNKKENKINKIFLFIGIVISPKNLSNWIFENLFDNKRHENSLVTYFVIIEMFSNISTALLDPTFLNILENLLRSDPKNSEISSFMRIEFC